MLSEKCGRSWRLLPRGRDLDSNNKELGNGTARAKALKAHRNWVSFILKILAECPLWARHYFMGRIYIRGQHGHKFLPSSTVPLPRRL